MQNFSEDIWRELNVFCKLNFLPVASWSWCTVKLCLLLQSYPSGLSRAVVLTELGKIYHIYIIHPLSFYIVFEEYKWKQWIEKGEYLENISRILKGHQLLRTDIICGIISDTSHATGKFLISSINDNSSIACILDRLFDIVSQSFSWLVSQLVS